jgi:hypothetical protein
MDKKEKKNDVIIWASRDKEQFYDLIVDSILKHKIDNMNDIVDSGKDIMMIYSTFVGISKKQYNGLDVVFKLEGLIEIFNKYFARNKIDLAARKDLHNGYESIRIYRLVRIKKGIGGGGKEGVVSKTDRIEDKDDIAISEEKIDKEKVKKKIEESRKLITEG